MCLKSLVMKNFKRNICGSILFKGLYGSENGAEGTGPIGSPVWKLPVLFVSVEKMAASPLKDLPFMVWSD